MDEVRIYEWIFGNQEWRRPFMEYLAHTDKNRTQTMKEHLYGTAELAGKFAGRFGKEEWGYCCGLLHDIGKTVELSGPVVPSYTFEGQMLGHISIAQSMVYAAAQELHIEGEEVTLLQHMILSHHGKNEYGSPVLPQIREAEMLHMIDNMDARMNMFNKALDTLESGETSKRIFSLENRTIYKPKMYE